MKACVFTLGCKMNEVESMSLMQGLEARGFEVTDVPEYADLYLLNTCAVTAEAERKSRQAVARLRKYNSEAPVIVCGCASEHSPEAFENRRGVTFVSGAMGKDKLLDFIAERGARHETESVFCELPVPKHNKTRAYLRIQDGCNRFCSYCLIPYLRGRTRSRSAEKILEEANASPSKEIVLTGIDISSYRDAEIGLGELLLLLKDVPARIRLGSLEPCVITEAFLQQARAAGNIAAQFHLSLQSGSSAVLRQMNRRYTRKEYLEKCALIYRYFPDAAITTDIIVGYPTEREEDFLESLSIVEEARLARVHAFPFSPRAGTNAAKLKDLSSEIKKERMSRMLTAAQRAEDRYIQKFIGNEQVALFEDGGGYTSNYIRVCAEGAKEGSMYRVKLIEKKQDGVFVRLLKEL